MDRMLEVRVAHAADADAAEAGGADRLLVGAWSDRGLRSPEPALVSSICRSTDLPIRVLLRLDDGDSTTGAGLVRLAGLTGDYVAAGAAGVAYGFLDADLEIDTELCADLAQRAGVPWTFTRAFDRALDPRRAWRRVTALPGLDGVLTAGSALGVEHGQDALLATAGSNPAAAALIVAAGGLRPEHVPWLVRAGVHRIHLASAVRRGGSWTKAYTDAGLVRSWRLLLDDAVDRSETA